MPPADTIERITLWQLAGRPMSAVSAAALLVLLALLVLGLLARVRKRDTATASWWVTSVSLWILAAGVLSFACHFMASFAKIGMAAIDAATLNRILAEGFARLFFGAFVAAAGFTVRLIVGPPRAAR
jgi:hypothetical protein